MLGYSDYGGFSGKHYVNNNSSRNAMSSPWYPPVPGPSGSFNFIMETPPSNSREMRNRAEKMRRDKLNSFIGELATLVPLVAKSAKRMDKTSILRLTASHLRLYQTMINAGRNLPHLELPKNINTTVVEQLVCDQLGGFLLLVTSAGKIVFVSQTVETLLGHLQTDLMGQSLFNVTAPDDHDRLKLFLNPESNLERHFNIRLKRAGPRTESPVYEPVRIIGMNLPTSHNDQNQNTSTSSSSSSSASDVASTSSNVNSNDVLVFFVKVFRPEPIQERLMEASKDEYVTRHLIDGRIINCDQRISIIAGYMTEEVSGLSAFNFMHRDDVRWVIIALRQMYDRRESKGSSCYRLLSRNGQFIYLRTVGFLEIDDEGTVESFVCVNTLVCEKEGLHLISEMKKRYSAIINSRSPALDQSSPGTKESSINTVEDPVQLQSAIVHLITNLPSPGSDQRSTPSPRIYPHENQDCSTSSESSPAKSYPVRYKTAQKRPPSTDIEVNVYKRHKHSPSNSPLPHLKPYHKRPQITEITTQQQEQTIFKNEINY